MDELSFMISHHIEPGDWIHDTELQERVAVIAIEDWAEAEDELYPVAILQYEDGVLDDIHLPGGVLPPRYTPLPAAGSPAPTPDDACRPHRHRFDVNCSGVKPRSFFPWIGRTHPTHHRSGGLSRCGGSRSGRPQAPMPAVATPISAPAGVC